MKRFLNLFVLIVFCCSNFSSSLVFAQIADLPQPGTMVNISAKGDLPLLKGLRLNPENPLKMDFIIEPNGALSITKDDAARLARYFLAALAMPKEDTWVNLSPYESQRIVPQAMADTDLGKDLLEQDYLLKQLASSLTYPESESGKQYWNAINNPNRSLSEPRPSIHPASRRDTQGAARIETTQSFNKVWIVPAKASVYENGNTVLISESSLSVKTEEDYLACRQAGLAAQQNNDRVGSRPASTSIKGQAGLAPTDAFKQHILPLIEKDVNQGKNFAQLRQIYSALILAEWFKHKFFDSFYHNYINQAKTKGITIDEKDAKDKIYALYVEAFKKGAYNYIKREGNGDGSHFSGARNGVEKRTVPAFGTRITKRQYFSGGVAAATLTVTPGAPTQPSSAAVVALGQVESGVISGIALRNEHSVAPQVTAEAVKKWLDLAWRSASRGMLEDFINPPEPYNPKNVDELGLVPSADAGLRIVAVEDKPGLLPGVFSYYEFIQDPHYGPFLLIVTQQGLTPDERKEAFQRAYDAYLSSKREDVQLAAVSQALIAIVETQPLLKKYKHADIQDILLHWCLVDKGNFAHMALYAREINKFFGLDAGNEAGRAIIQQFDIACSAQLRRLAAMRAGMLAAARLDNPEQFTALEEKAIRDRTSPEYGLLAGDLGEESRGLHHFLIRLWLPESEDKIFRHEESFARRGNLKMNHRTYDDYDRFARKWQYLKDDLEAYRGLSAEAFMVKAYPIDPRDVLGDTALLDGFKVMVIENPRDRARLESELGLFSLYTEGKLIDIFVNPRLSAQEKERRIFYGLCLASFFQDPTAIAQAHDAASTAVRAKFPRLPEASFVKLHEALLKGGYDYLLEQDDTGNLAMPYLCYEEAYVARMKKLGVPYVRQRYLEKFGVEAPKDKKTDTSSGAEQDKIYSVDPEAILGTVTLREFKIEVREVEPRSLLTGNVSESSQARGRKHITISLDRRLSDENKTRQIFYQLARREAMNTPGFFDAVYAEAAAAARRINPVDEPALAQFRAHVHDRDIPQNIFAQPAFREYFAAVMLLTDDMASERARKRYFDKYQAEPLVSHDSLIPSGAADSLAADLPQARGRKSDTQLLEALRAYTPPALADIVTVEDDEGDAFEVRIIDDAMMPGYYAVALHEGDINAGSSHGDTPVVAVSRSYYMRYSQDEAAQREALLELIGNALHYGAVAPRPLALDDPQAKVEMVDTQAILGDAPLKGFNKVQVTVSKPIPGLEEHKSISYPEGDARALYIWVNSGLSADEQKQRIFYELCYYSAANDPRIFEDAIVQARQAVRAKTNITSGALKVFERQLRELNYAQREKWTSRRTGQWERYLRDYFRPAFDELARRHVAYRFSSRYPDVTVPVKEADWLELIKAFDTRDIYDLLKVPAAAGRGDAEIPSSAAKKPGPQTAAVSDDDRKALLNDATPGFISQEFMISKYTGSELVLVRVFEDDAAAMKDRDGVFIDRLWNKEKGNYVPVVAVTKTRRKDEKSLAYLFYHDIVEGDHVDRDMAGYRHTLKADQIQKIIDKAHEEATAGEILLWVAHNGMRLLPRHLDALGDPKRARALVQEWNEGWLEKHQTAWALYRPEDRATLEQYAKLFNEQAVGGEDFRGLDTKASGKFDKMELKGTDLKDLGDLNVQITAIVPFVP